MRGYLAPALAATVALIPRASPGQELAPGQRVRVRTSAVSERPLVGTFARHDSTTLWLRRDSSLDSIPLAAIRALERSAGAEQIPPATGLLSIVWLGGLAGATYAGSQSQGCNSSLEHIGCGLLGLLLGGFILSEVTEHVWPRRSAEKWVRVSVPAVSLRPCCSPRVTVALAFRLSRRRRLRGAT